MVQIDLSQSRWMVVLLLIVQLEDRSSAVDMCSLLTLWRLHISKWPFSQPNFHWWLSNFYFSILTMFSPSTILSSLWHLWIIRWIIYPSFGSKTGWIQSSLKGYLFNLPPSHNNGRWIKTIYATAFLDKVT